MNELWCRWSEGKVGKWVELILQPLRHFTYVIAHFPTLPSLHLRHSSFSNSSVALPTSQLILQPFFSSSYITGSSLTSPGGRPCIYPTLNRTFSQNIVADTDKNKALIDCHKCSSSFLSIVKSHPLQIPVSVLGKVRAGSCLKLFLIDCSYIYICAKCRLRKISPWVE